MKNKIIAILLSIWMVISMVACGKAENVTEDVDVQEPVKAEETASEDEGTAVFVAEPTPQATEEPASEPVISWEPVIAEQDVTNKYEGFLAGLEPLYFNKYMHMDWQEGIFETGRGYTLDEILNALSEAYWALEEQPEIHYLYMDCGNDGVQELAVEFYGMSIYSPGDDSTLVYVIKEREGQLELCYCYETWARSHSELNYYGYYTSGGSNGASNHGWDAGYINAEGDWNFIYYTEEELDINQLSADWELNLIPGIAKSKQYDGEIIVVTTRFDEIVYDGDTSNYYDIQRYHSYFVDGVDEGVDVYSDGVYKEIFDEAGVVTYLYEEIGAMIDEKEAALGITEEIKQGQILEWER